MVADSDPGLVERLLTILTFPLWGPVWGIETLWRRRRKPQPMPEIWVPKSETERAVLAALILAGRPVTNDELAQFMGCSKSEASKRVSQIDGHIRKIRDGRKVQISLLN